jgi:hypothetical protein
MKFQVLLSFFLLCMGLNANAQLGILIDRDHPFQ